MTALWETAVRLAPVPVVFGLEVPSLPRTHISRADAKKRKKVFSTRYRRSQDSHWAPGPACSRCRTHTVPASYMVRRVRKGPQVSEGFTLVKGSEPQGHGPLPGSLPAPDEPRTPGPHTLAHRTHNGTGSCPPGARTPPRDSLPHGVAQEDSGTQEGGEAEQGEEHGAHVRGQPGPAGRLAVRQQARLETKLQCAATATPSAALRAPGRTSRKPREQAGWGVPRSDPRMRTRDLTRLTPGTTHGSQSTKVTSEPVHRQHRAGEGGQPPLHRGHSGTSVWLPFGWSAAHSLPTLPGSAPNTLNTPLRGPSLPKTGVQVGRRAAWEALPS